MSLALKTPSSGFFPWLDPLRFFAAASVVLVHLHVLLMFPIPDFMPFMWFRVGFLGVDLFFAISGAVIALSLLRFLQRDPAHWRSRFALRRIARLLPLYVLTGLIFVICVQPEILHRADAGWVIGTHLLFVHNLFPSTHGVINGPSWSLGVEMQFYLLMLLVGPWLLKLRPMRLLGLLLGMAVLWRAGVWLWSTHVMEEELGGRMFVFVTQLPGVLDCFAGGIIAVVWRSCCGAEAAGRRLPWLVIAALLAWALSLWLLISFFAFYWSAPVMLLGLRALIAMAAGLTVAAVISIPTRWQPGKLGRLLGDLSYGVYLWHIPALLWWQRQLPAMDSVPMAGLVAATTVLLALTTWYLVEKPILRWAQRH